MANPARLLAETLIEWQEVPPSKTSESVRGDPQWVAHRRALRHLLAIEQFLTAMEASGQPAQEFRECMPAWTAALFSFNAGWRSKVGASRMVIDDGDLRVLRSLATLMETAQYVQAVTAPAAKDLVESLERAEQLIRASPSIGPDTRRYLLGLVAEATATIKDVETFGEAEARRAVFELGGAMQAIVGQLHDRDDGPMWATRVADLLEKVVLLSVGVGLAYVKTKLQLPGSGS